jgi:hypothetical protein
LQRQFRTLQCLKKTVTVHRILTGSQDKKMMIKKKQHRVFCCDKLTTYGWFWYFAFLKRDQKKQEVRFCDNPVIL